jgi:hypothetical protein
VTSSGRTACPFGPAGPPPTGFGGAAEPRFARDPAQATATNGVGEPTQPLTLAGRAVPLEYSAGETVRMKAEWACSRV